MCRGEAYRSLPYVPILRGMRTARRPNWSRSTRIFPILACFVLFAAIASGTGFGASTGSIDSTATLASTLTLTDPASLGAQNPVCTSAAAPADTDGCGDVTYSPTPTPVLSLGALSGNDVQAGSLTWGVTTTSPTGYTVTLSNASGSAPMLKSPAGNIADVSDSPIAAGALAGATQFGVAMGNAATDGETAVNFLGSPWVGGGQQGELFRGIPVGGMLIAKSTTAAANDPFTTTFAAASVASAAPAAGAYTGSVKLVASSV